MARTRKGIFIALIIWLVILGGVGAVVKFLVLPMFQEKKEDELLSQTSADVSYKYEVSLGGDSFAGYGVWRSREFSGRLKPHGIRIKFVDDGANYHERFKRLRDKEVQMALFPIDSYLTAGDELGNDSSIVRKFPGAIVLLVDVSAGADAIVAWKQGVLTFDDLNHEKARMVFTPDSPSELLCRVAKASFSLPRMADKWYIEEDGAEEVYKKFISANRAEKRVYALWEPYVSMALEDPDAHALLTSGNARNLIVDVLVVNREFLVNNKSLVKRVVEEYLRSVYAYSKSGYSALLVEQSPDVERYAERMAKGIRWVNTVENYGHFGLQQSDLAPLHDIVGNVVKALRQIQLLDEDPLQGNYTQIYYDGILREIKADGFHPGQGATLLTGITTNVPGEQVRVRQSLAELSDAEWKRLLPVGNLETEVITFGRGRSTMNPNNQRKVERLADTMGQWPDYYLTVLGFVKPIAGADERAVLGLAQRRADAVQEILIDEGVSRNRLRTKALKGDSTTVVFRVGQLPY